MPPGLLIAAPASGSGKTTLMLGLLRAFTRQGLWLAPFKCGPDYIDPGFHAAACGRASCNLDGWAMDGATLNAIGVRAAGADLALAEGSMGLFDGVARPGESSNGASAAIARHMGWPVVLVIDVSGQAQSAAALASGFVQADPQLSFAGVVLNKVASPRHEALVRAGMEAAGLRVLGALPRQADLALPERHLGLVQALEHPELEERLDALADFVEAHLDLAMLRGLAATADWPDIDGQRGEEPGLPPPPAQTIAMASDAAFSFAYPHLVDHWRAKGAQVVPFSPLANEAPDGGADMVWLPGGYPELHAGRIAGAGQFLAGLRNHARTRPVHGECGGYMVLGQSMIDKQGNAHAMAGLLGLVTTHAQRRMNLGYRRARLLAPIGALPVGADLRGHEFHYTTIVETRDPPLAFVADADGVPVAQTGSVRGGITGSFFHMIAGRKRP